MSAGLTGFSEEMKSFFEWCVDRVIELILSQINSFDARITLFSQLANYRFRDKRTKMRVANLVRRLRNVNSQRNDIVHGTWKGFSNPAYIVKYQRQKPSISWRQIQATPRGIRSDVKKIWQLLKAIRRFSVHVTKLNDRELKAAHRAASRHKP